MVVVVQITGPVVVVKTAGPVVVVKTAGPVVVVKTAGPVVVIKTAGSVVVVKTAGLVVVVKPAGLVVVVKTAGPVVVVEACSHGVVVVVSMVSFCCQVVVDLAWLFFMVCGRFKSPRPVKLISCLSLSGDGIESPLTPTRWSIIFTRADLSSLSCSCTA